MRNLTDKELDSVCGGWGFSVRIKTGDVYAIQKNDAYVAFSAHVDILQSNNINTGVQL
jgi:hypothetical protein